MSTVTILLDVLSGLAGLIFFVFGFINIFNPKLGFSFFTPLTYPKEKHDQQSVHVLLAVGGAKNLFIGFAIEVATWYVQDPKVTGALVVAAGCTAAIDGVACQGYLGKGQWDHWTHGLGILGLGITVLLFR